ncbi:MAG: iron-containing alcohol dehydrogenase [Candidatus Latescibacteria bacterium]|nr:iron-containing alcohol dehydrogenase [Candidatus Latescibacterota bacterium]
MAYQEQFSYYAPTRLVVGRGTLGEIPGLLADRPEKKALIITDAGLKEAGLIDTVTDVLETARIEYAVFDGVEANPPIRVVKACADQYSQADCDWLLAVGGGSSMDVAKAAGVLVTNEGKIEDYFGAGKVKTRVPFLVCVPTTYGTASEVTPFAVVTDDSNYKSAVVGPEIIPDVGILDADMAVALPYVIAGATGMDALTHAVESYTSLGSNLISEGLAIHAIRLIAENLRQAAAGDHNHVATERMLIASNMAGMAFAQSRLGNVHAMSHPVSGHHGTAHGVANAILLTRIMEFNRIACPERFANIAVAMGEDVSGLSAMDASAFAVEAVEALGFDVGIPETLSEAGVDGEKIETMTDDALKSPNVEINPRKTTREDIVELYEASM